MPFAAAIVILSLAVAGASGAVSVNKPVDLSKLKNGVAEYKVNK